MNLFTQRGSQSLSPPKYRAQSYDDSNAAYMLGDSTRVSRITQAERIIRFVVIYLFVNICSV